jgi:hypothetical protein
MNLQEAVVEPPYVAFAIRPNPGVWEYVRVNSEDLSVEPITSTQYLKFKERVYDEKWYVFSLQYFYIFKILCLGYISLYECPM